MHDLGAPPLGEAYEPEIPALERRRKLRLLAGKPPADSLEHLVRHKVRLADEGNPGQGTLVRD